MKNFVPASGPHGFWWEISVIQSVFLYSNVSLLSAAFDIFFCFYMFNCNSSWHRFLSVYLVWSSLTFLNLHFDLLLILKCLSIISVYGLPALFYFLLYLWDSKYECWHLLLPHTFLKLIFLPVFLLSLIQIGFILLIYFYVHWFCHFYSTIGSKQWVLKIWLLVFQLYPLFLFNGIKCTYHSNLFHLKKILLTISCWVFLFVFVSRDFVIAC